MSTGLSLKKTAIMAGLALGPVFAAMAQTPEPADCDVSIYSWLTETGPCENGIRQGEWESRNPRDSTLAWRGSYKDGLRQGYWTYYHSETQVSEEGEYVDNERQGDWTFYHPNGKIASYGFFNKGYKMGEWKYFDENCVLIEREVYNSKGEPLMPLNADW